MKVAGSRKVQHSGVFRLSTRPLVLLLEYVVVPYNVGIPTST